VIGARGAIALVFVFLSLVLSGCDPFNRDEFKHELDTLHSVSAEGGLLAGQVVKEDTRTAFVRVQAGHLSETATARAEKLTDAQVPADLETDVNKTISLAEAISSQLQDLEFSPGDASKATEVQNKLRGLTGAIDHVEAGL
jgi:hypothetical protein